MSVGMTPEQEPLIQLESISKLYGSGDAQVAAHRAQCVAQVGGKGFHQQ